MQIIRYPLAWLLSVLLALTPVISAQAAMVDNGMLLGNAATAHTRDSLQQLLDTRGAEQHAVLVCHQPLVSYLIDHDLG